MTAVDMAFDEVTKNEFKQRVIKERNMAAIFD